MRHRAAISGTTFLVPYQVAMSLQLVGRSGTSSINQRVQTPSELQWRDWQCTRIVTQMMTDSEAWLITVTSYDRDDVSAHQRHDYLFNRLFRHRSKKTSKLCVTGLCGGNSPMTGEFPTQRASNAEKVSIWWRLHVKTLIELISLFFLVTQPDISHA